MHLKGLHKTLNSVDNNEVEGLSSFKRVLDGPEGHAHVDNFEGLDYYFKQLTTTDQFCKNVWRLRFAENSLVVSGFFIAKNSPYRDVLNYRYCLMNSDMNSGVYRNCKLTIYF